MANTKIGARLESVASDGIVAGADAIYDDELSKSQAEINQGISDLAEKANYVGITTLDLAPTSATLTYTVGTETRNFKVGDEVRVADVESETGYKFYKLNALNVTNAGEPNEATAAVWQELGSGAGGSTDLDEVAFIGDTAGSATSPSFDPLADTVHVTPQVLTSAQQAQARTNIGAASVEDAGAGTIDYTEEATQISSIDATLATTALRKTAQTLTAAEKAQVRTNLGLDSAYITQSDADGFVSTAQQSLTSTQKNQAIANLGLDSRYLSTSDADTFVSVQQQNLTAAQKLQVKTNLDITDVALEGNATGAIIAQSNTNYTTAQVRNIVISTVAPTVNDGNNGDIWIVYEPVEEEEE